MVLTLADRWNLSCVASVASVRDAAGAPVVADKVAVVACFRAFGNAVATHCRAEGHHCANKL